MILGGRLGSSILDGGGRGGARHDAGEESECGQRRTQARYGEERKGGWRTDNEETEEMIGYVDGKTEAEGSDLHIFGTHTSSGRDPRTKTTQ